MSDVVALTTPGVTQPQRMPAILRIALQGLALILVLNGAFLALRIADGLIDKRVVASALREGYANGSMTTANYSGSLLLGVDQYSDCVTAQLAVVGAAGSMQNAVTPHLLSEEQVAADAMTVPRQRCRELKDYVDGRYHASQPAPYARFWHGSASVLAAALTQLPVDGYRALLLNLTFALMALTGILAARAQTGLLLAIAPLLCVSFLFNGQFGYGQLFSYGPAQIALWAMAALTVAWGGRLQERGFLLLALTSGALEAFVDQLISPPLVATSYLIIAQFTWMQGTARQTLPRTIKIAAKLYAFWSAGFVGTYLVKLVLSMAVLGTSAFDDMIAQLVFRLGTVDPEFGLHPGTSITRLELLGLNLATLLRSAGQLGFSGAHGGQMAVTFAVFLTFSGWLLALYGLIRNARRAPSFVSAGIPYLAASLFILLWVFVLPEHTLRHAFFMVRSATVWIFAGWGWLCTAYAFSGAPFKAGSS